MRGLAATLGSLRVLTITVERLKVSEENLRKGFLPEIFATDRALEVVVEGTPFRDAYRQVAANLSDLAARNPVANLKSKTLQGGPGNLGLAALEERADEADRWLASVRDPFRRALDALLA